MFKSLDIQISIFYALNICVFKRTNTKVSTYFNVSTIKYLYIYIFEYTNM